VWELDRALEDDTRAASLFAWLGAAGAFTWLASIVLADSLLPITTITALGALGKTAQVIAGQVSKAKGGDKKDGDKKDDDKA